MSAGQSVSPLWACCSTLCVPLDYKLLISQFFTLPLIAEARGWTTFSQYWSPCMRLSENVSGQLAVGQYHVSLLLFIKVTDPDIWWFRTFMGQWALDGENWKSSVCESRFEPVGSWSGKHVFLRRPNESSVSPRRSYLQHNSARQGQQWSLSGQQY